MRAVSLPASRDRAIPRRLSYARAIGAGGLAVAVMSACSLIDDLSDIRPAADGAPAVDGAADAPPSEQDAAGDVAEGGAEAGDGGHRGCPSGRGPEMVTIERDGGARFCIDANEVTNAQYGAFLASVTQAELSATHTAVSGTLGCPEIAKASMAPSADWPTAASSSPDRPVVYVGWCKAIAYCRWAGKHLCRAHGGGTVPPGQRNDPSTSEWYAACSREGTRRYAYGATYVADACNVGADASADVGAHVACEGGYPGLFDMNGNVSEWELGVVDSGASTFRSARGGSWYLPSPDQQSCDQGHAIDDGQALVTGSPDTGFRCCASRSE